MAVTAVRAYVHNDTDQILSLVSSEVPSGEWATSPPAQIAPFSVGYMRAEADGLDPDTEGRATYRIGGDPATQLYVHFDDPFVGSNAFHVNTDDTHYAFHGGGEGRHAEVHFVLRDARPVETGFLPSLDGFRFSNHWDDPTPYSLPPLRGSLLDQKYGNAGNGLCGGMVLAARDYFETGWRIPATDTAPLGEQDPLFVYLVDRLFDTFSVDSVTLMLALMNPLYPDGDENVASVLGLASGRAAVMANEEWPLIRADIDAGHPSPMCLITVKSALPWDLGENHQVLAYGYEAHGHHVTIRVYDPNSPKSDDVHLTFDDGDVSQRIVVSHNVDVTDDDDHHVLPVYCFARMDYAVRTPTVPTEARPAGARTVGLEVGERVVTSTQVTGTGRRTYPVGPNCGDAEFAYRDLLETEKVSLVARARNFFEPTLVWRVGGVDIPDGTTAERQVSGQREEGAVEPVWLRVTAAGGELQLESLHAMGHFFVPVEVRVQETTGAPGPITRTTTLEYTESRTEVDGLAEATQDCFRKYLRELNQELPDVQATVAALYTRLRRPPDPLWDPDPVMVDVVAGLAQDDPFRAPVVADIDLAHAQHELFVADLARQAAVEAAKQSQQEVVSAGDHVVTGLDVEAAKAEAIKVAKQKEFELQVERVRDLGALVKDLPGLGGR